MTSPEPDEARPKGERLAPLGLIVTTVSRLPDLFIPVVAALYGTRDSDFGAVPVIAVILVFSLVFRWLAWTRFRYFVGEDDIRVEQGLLSRSARSVPYDRIADVSIERPALARMLGLAVVRFETGGGKGEEAELRYVSEADAERLRDTVRARKAGVEVRAEGAGEAVEEPAARLLFAMNTARLLTLGFYSFSLVIFAVLLGLAQQLDFLLPFDWDDAKAWLGNAESGGLAVTRLDRSTQLFGLLGALAALVVLGIASGVVRTVLTDWGFRLERTAKGLRRRRGLLTLTDMTIPVGRVQAAMLGTGAIRARRGWHHLVAVTLASNEGGGGNQVLAPLARLDELEPILAELKLAAAEPGLPFARAHPGPWIDRALLRSVALAGAAAAAAWAGVPFAWLAAVPIIGLACRDWLRWSGEWRAHDAAQLYDKSGRWNRWVTFARKINVQSVTISRSPSERLRGLATLNFGIAGGALGFLALPLAEAEAIRADVLAVITPVDFSRLARLS